MSRIDWIIDVRNFARDVYNGSVERMSGYSDSSDSERILMDVGWYSNRLNFYNGFINGLRKGGFNDGQIADECVSHIYENICMPRNLMEFLNFALQNERDTLPKDYVANYDLLLKALVRKEKSEFFS